MIVVKLVSRTHQNYLIFVTEQLHKEYGTPADLALLQQFYSDLIFWITPVDLSATASLMRSGYSPKTKGRKPRDPSDMLRSTLLMTKLGMSVDDWVCALRTTPVYAILSGFAPGDTPGVGTFYDFFRRLWKASTPHKTGRRKRRLKKPRKKGKKNEKQEPKNPKITEKLVSRVLREEKIHYTPKEHDLLQHLFQTLFVLPSAAKGLLGDTRNFRVIGDGSPVATGARSYGKFLCDCRKTGNWKCDCKRQYADPDADWGWDSYRERYYYGRTLYMFCAADSPYNLPVYPRLFRASQHDTVSWVCGYRELRHWYPQWKLGEAILDSAHDALPIYTMLEHDDVSAIIDLNPRRSGKLVSGDITFGTDGVPVCPIGRKMINWGKNSKSFRNKWRCPAKVGKWECPHPCSESEYGRTVYTSTKDNPRFFPRIRRDSKEWTERYALRTGVERCIKRQKVDYKLESSRGRSSRHWNIRVYLIAMCQHADAWLEEAKKQNRLTSVAEWLETIALMAA
ncbi:DDE transposase [Paenibacillus sp. 32O-W]|uniref:DDE transposase n=1 Tax=Paenibacillus sp. 32O-W TaxID=1695218 RepID=UPI0011A79365|nr:DDE transposase [Paenibacillus sp. 32O-W]